MLFWLRLLNLLILVFVKLLELFAKFTGFTELTEFNEFPEITEVNKFSFGLYNGTNRGFEVLLSRVEFTSCPDRRMLIMVKINFYLLSYILK